MPQLELLIDADAFLIVRKLSLLEMMKRERLVRLHMMQYAARHDLSSIGREIAELEALGQLIVHAVERRSKADELYRRLQRDDVDKGEAEAIAWASVERSDEIIFVSGDRGARRHAKNQGVSAADLMDLVVLLVDRAKLPTGLVEERLAPWLDPEQQLGRPGDLVPFDFDGAFEARRARWGARPAPPE